VTEVGTGTGPSNTPFSGSTRSGSRLHDSRIGVTIGRRRDCRFCSVSVTTLCYHTGTVEHVDIDGPVAGRVIPSSPVARTAQPGSGLESIDADDRVFDRPWSGRLLRF
jgi:hypothetical protein